MRRMLGWIAFVCLAAVAAAVWPALRRTMSAAREATGTQAVWPPVPVKPDHS